MATISPGPLQALTGAGDSATLVDFNGEEITRVLFAEKPTKQNGTATTIIGPPATGAHVLLEYWRDALGGLWRCDLAGTPGTWNQVRPAVTEGEPSTGTIPTAYLINDADDSGRLKIHSGSYVWAAVYATATPANDLDALAAAAGAGGTIYKSGLVFAATGTMTGIIAWSAAGPEAITGLTADRLARIGTSGLTLVNSIARDNGTYFAVGADTVATAGVQTTQLTGGATLCGGASSINTLTGALTLNTTDSSAINFQIGGANGWRVKSNSVLESQGAQTIQTSTGNLTLATGAANGHIIFDPHGTGNYGFNASSFGTSAAGVLAVFQGTAPTSQPADTVQLWVEDYDGEATKGALHIMSESGMVVKFGNASINIRDATTDATTKNARFNVGHYTNAEEPVGAFFANSTSTANNIRFGGSSSTFNAATNIEFYTAATTTTVTGTLRLSISSAGAVNVASLTASRMVLADSSKNLTSSIMSESGATIKYNSGAPIIQFGDGTNTGIFTGFDFPDVTSANCRFRYFRSTNTSGIASVLVCKADGTGTSQHELHGNGDAWLCLALGSVGIKTNAPTALCHIAAGNSSANGAPLKLTTGTLLATKEAGAFGYNGNHYETTVGLVRYGKGGSLFDHNTDAGNGTTVETDLYTNTLVAAALTTNGDKVTAVYSGIFVNSTSTKQLKVYFGGTAIFDSGALSTAAAGHWEVYVAVIRVSSSVVRCSVSMSASGVGTLAAANYTEVTGLTLANTQVLKITGTAAAVGAATNDIVAKLGIVEFLPAAA